MGVQYNVLSLYANAELMHLNSMQLGILLSLSLFLKVLITYLYLAFKALNATLWLQRIAF